MIPHTCKAMGLLLCAVTMPLVCYGLLSSSMIKPRYLTSLSMSVTDVSKPSAAAATDSVGGSTKFLYKSSQTTGIYEEINLNPASTTAGLSSLLTLTVKRVSFKGDDDEDENDIQRSHLLSAKIMQVTDGPVPRSYLPSILVLSHEIDGTMKGDDGYDFIAESKSPIVNESDLSTLVEACLHWYLDSGGRITQLDLISPTTYSGMFESMGFDPVEALLPLDDQVVPGDESATREYLMNTHGVTSSDYQVFTCNVARYMATIRSRIDQSIGHQYVQYNILGRLSHSIKAFDAAIQNYTDSLRLKPESSSTFRNLGAAYHAAGNMQLAFASYQQSIQLDPTGE